MEVVSPGAVGSALVKGVSVEQYRQINEFSLSEQSKSRSTFGTEPMTKSTQLVQYWMVNAETNLGRPREMSEWTRQ